MRHRAGILIGGVLLLLAGGFYSIADSARYREPFGYGASGFGLVMLAAALGRTGRAAAAVAHRLAAAGSAGG
jgi:uncharacterized membrane protein YccC